MAVENISVTDWKTLDAGAALDRLVAERLAGMKVMGTPVAYYQYPVGDKFATICLWWSTPDGWQFHPFSTDAAAPLPLGPNDLFDMEEYTSGWGCRATVRNRYDERETCKWETAPTLALARLRAWLARDDAKRAAETDVQEAK